MSANEANRSTPGALSSDAVRCAAARTAEAVTGPQRRAELELVSRLIARDEAAWQELIDSYRGAVLRGAIRGLTELRVTPTEARIEEVCADVVFALFRNDCAALRSFQGRSTLSTWLAVISRRVCIATQLKHERIGSARAIHMWDVDWQALPARHTSEDPAEERTGDLRLMQACFSKLSASDQVILELCFLKGLSYQTIADALGITRNAVGPKLTRARQRLRRLMVLQRQAATTGPATPTALMRRDEHGSL